MHSILTLTGIVENTAESVMDVLKDHRMEAGRASFPLLAYFVTMDKFFSFYEP